MPFTVKFKYSIGEKVLAEDKETNKFISTKILSLCFNGEANLYYIEAPDYKSDWIREEYIKKDGR